MADNIVHTSAHTESEMIAHANAIFATREIAAWLRTLDPAPVAPAALAERIEAEFIATPEAQADA